MSPEPQTQAWARNPFLPAWVPSFLPPAWFLGAGGGGMVEGEQ